MSDAINPSPPPPVRVLIADDDKVYRVRMSNFLTSQGYEPLLAANGREALDVMAQEGPPAVLLDLRMPVVDGLEVLAGIASDHPGTVVIVLTAQGGIEDSIQALRLGAWDFVVKSLQDREIVRIALEKGLAYRRMELENAAHREHLEEMVRARTRQISATAEKLRSEIQSRKTVQARLEDLEHTARIMVEQASEGILVLRDGILRYFNPKTAGILALGHDVLMDLPLASLVAEESRADFQAQCGRCSLTLGLTEGHIHAFDTPAGRKWLYFSCVCIKWESFTVLLALLMDMTERKRLEQELVRTREEALAANKAKREFLGAMRHEIRTPLNEILGMADILQDTTQDSSQAEGLGIILSAGRTLLDRLNDILDFNTIRSSQVVLERKIFDPAALLTRTAAMFEASARRKGLELRTEISPLLPGRVIGDDERLRQILMNILANALKFTPGGFVILRARPTAYSGQEQTHTQKLMLVIEVEDTGIGIPEDQKERIFDMFTQADQSLTRSYGGAGLGLAISRHLVRMMGGEISVESSPGQGSTFTFTAVFDDPGESGAATSPAVGIPAPSRRLTILVAEDNLVNRKILAHHLQKLGHEHIQVENGLDVLQALTQHHFDLILMDVEMPQMDGLEATRAIRASQTPGVDPAIPIIGLTGHSGESEMAFFRSQGMNECLSKPVDRDQLANAIERFTKDRPAPVTCPPECPPLPRLDKAGALARLDGDEELLREMFQAFLEDAPSRMVKIDRAHTDNTLPDIHRLAHALKGAAATIGAERLRALAYDMEKAAKAGLAGDVAALRQPLTEETKALLEELENEVKD